MLGPSKHHPHGHCTKDFERNGFANLEHEFNPMMRDYVDAISRVGSVATRSIVCLYESTLRDRVWLRMKLAKPHFDVGAMTDRLQEMLAFWQGPVGLPFEEILATGGGNHPHRHAMNGSIFKLNHPRKGLSDTPPSGYQGLWIARDGLDVRQELVDPDGNRVILVPRGEEDIEGVAMTVGVRDLEALARFYTEGLQLEELSGSRFRSGDSILFVEHDPNAADHTDKGSFYGRGFRYLTIQVFDCAGEHARILAAGGIEGLAPRQIGEVAFISMVRDPDDNWIEISQRASLTGPLPGSREAGRPWSLSQHPFGRDARAFSSISALRNLEGRKRSFRVRLRQRFRALTSDPSRLHEKSHVPHSVRGFGTDSWRGEWRGGPREREGQSRAGIAVAVEKSL